MAIKFDPILGKLREQDAGVPGADGADGVVQAVVAGSNITVDATDPANPIVKLSTMASKTYKGRTTAGAGVVEDVAVATLKTDLGLVKADVGLGNVDNTSDANKPVSTATQTALDGKANSLGADDNYVTDAEKTKLSNLSGTNTGDQDLSTLAPKASPTFTGTVILPKTLEIQDTSADHQYVLAVSELTADRTVTLPLLTTDDEFVFKDHAQTLSNKTFVAPALGTPTSGVATNLTGTASGLTAGNVTTNANLTGHVTSTGNATVLGSFTKAQLDTAVSDGNVLYVGDVTSNATHTGDATGSGALTVVKIQGKDFPTLAAGDDQKYPKYVSASNAFVMTAIAGGGNVSNTGTPANNQVAVWTDATTIEGDAALTFDTTTDALSVGTGGIITTGTIELGAASDTTISRVSAGLIAVEGKTLLSNTSTAGVGATPTSSTTTAITHGLGRTPAMIRISGKSGFTSNAAATPTTSSEGIWNSSGNFCIYQSINGTTTIAAQTSSTFAIFLDTSVGNTISGVIGNVGATTFDIVWTETGTHTRGVYMWEAQ